MRIERRKFSADFLRQIISYDPETGIFHWRVSIRGVRKGRPAGYLTLTGYLTIRVCGVLYGAHHLAWLYMTGQWPTHEIDHKDCNPSNNKFSNLREATSSQNKGNMRRPSHNRSGAKGAYEDKRSGRWYAQIRKNDRQIHLGCFGTREEAAVAYEKAAREYFGEFARAA